MSLEQAIIEHAAAIRELATALTQRAAPLMALADEAQAAIREIKESAIATGDAEVEKDVQKADAEKESPARAAINAALEAARAKKEADPKPDASGAAKTKATPDGAQSAADDKPLDYLKDVAPTLNKLAKANRDALVALFAKYGAKKGAELKAEDYAAVLGEATELLGAAG